MAFGTKIEISRFRWAHDTEPGERSVDGTSSIISNARPMVVAIPAHNEAGYIGSCLNALARQERVGKFAVVALLNNCTDNTSGIVRGLAADLPYELHIRECWLDPSATNAGVARRLATQHAGKVAGENGIVLTTDADSRVATNWIAANVAEIDAGCDAVAGMAQIDDQDAATLPARLVIDEEKSEILGTLLDEIDWLLDPDASDPWPRHTQHSGASIAVRASCLAHAGGMPAIPLGEDRQFFARLRRIDARIRHSREVVVTVSGRTIGRAKGGMADTIARRMREADKWLDECVEPAIDHARRAILRACARKVWTGTSDEKAETVLATALRLSAAAIRRNLETNTFGRGWSDLERASPTLRRRAVSARNVERETVNAHAIIEDIRRRGLDAPIYRADIVNFASSR